MNTTHRTEENTDMSTTETDTTVEPTPTTKRLPCLSCGVATITPTNRTAVTVVEVNAYGPAGTVRGIASVPMTLCHDCRILAAKALTLAAAHPQLTQRLGQRGAVDATTGVLTACAVLGVRSPARDCTDRDLAAHVRALGSLGLAARWRSLVTAQTREDSTPAPWSAVTGPSRERLRAGYAELLAGRLAEARPPVRVAPPDPERPVTSTASIVFVGDGCLLCGVDGVDVPAVEVQRAPALAAVTREVWTRRGQVDPSTIGARPGPHKISGFTCPTCTAAAASAGGSGAGAAARDYALLLHLELSRKVGRDTLLRGVAAYGALVSDARRPDAQSGTSAPPASSSPWAHLGDLAEVRRAIEVGA